MELLLLGTVIGCMGKGERNWWGMNVGEGEGCYWNGNMGYSGKFIICEYLEDGVILGWVGIGLFGEGNEEGVRGGGGGGWKMRRGVF